MTHSVGEEFIAKILKNNNLDFDHDAPINGLKGVRNGLLRFDFVLKKNDNDAVIEYNGIYHYHVIKGKTNMYTLMKQQMNDFIKQDYCNRNNIPILWVPYWMNNTQITNAIYFFLFKYKMI